MISKNDFTVRLETEVENEDQRGFVFRQSGGI